MNSQREHEVQDQAEKVRGRLEGLTADLRVIDDEVESLAPQRKHHELLGRACSSLEELGELGAASLFWGDRIEPEMVARQMRKVRSIVGDFQAQLDKLDEQRQTLRSEIGLQEDNLEKLGEDLYDIRMAEERRKLEWIVERDVSAVPHRTQRMAWARGGEDDRRFRKSLAASMLAAAFLGLLLPMINLPLPKPFVPEDIPKRLARLVRPEQPKPLPKPPVAETPEQQEPRAVEQPSEPLPDAPVVAEAEPTPSERPGPVGPENRAVAAEPRANVGKAGILAFRDKFASLEQDKLPGRLGSDARYGNADDSSQAASRSMLTTNAPGSSGGINIGALSRNVGGGGGNGGGGGGGIHGVQVGRATSNITSIGGGGGGDGRPRAGGGQVPSRTDEEIQIVFDRYKASFYRLYNRELRKDPTLRGEMVLRLTIEPDGSVSMCKLQSTDMDAPDLAAQVLSRVRAISFGPKDDVASLTIVYPIDFLPKA